MLLMHILNLDIGQLTELNALLDSLSGCVRVNMNGYIPAVVRDGDTLADSFEIGAQLADIPVVIAAGDELRAVGVAVVHGMIVRLFLALCLFRFLGVEIDLLAVKHVGHGGENADKSAAARVNNARFFEHGEDVRRVGKGGLCALKTDIEYFYCVCLAVVYRFSRVLGRRADNRENGALGGLHDRFVGRGAAVLECGGHRCTVSLFEPFESLGKSAENERKYNAGVASRSAQQT